MPSLTPTYFQAHTGTTSHTRAQSITLATHSPFIAQELSQRQQQETESEQAIQATLDELAEFVDFPPNWDGYGAEKPGIQAITLAVDLLRTVQILFGWQAGARIEPQIVAPLPDGGIQIDWGSPQVKLIVLINPPGTLSYAWIDRRASKRNGEEIHHTSKETILKMIAKILFSAESNG